MTISETQAQLEAIQRSLDGLVREVQQVIVGQDEVLRSILTCLLAGGHGLLEGVPGLGKTLMIRTLASAVDISFNRIQFTPDLMPARSACTSSSRPAPVAPLTARPRGDVFTLLRPTAAAAALLEPFGRALRRARASPRPQDCAKISRPRAHRRSPGRPVPTRPPEFPL